MDCSSTKYEKVVGLTNTFSMNTNIPPIIRVIGFGNNIEKTLAKIDSKGYYGMKTEKYSEYESYTPTEEDKMIILLGSPNSERVRNIAKTFYEADVLTIIVMNRFERILTVNIDAYTIVKPEDIVKTVNALVDPLLMPCRIAFDFNDLKLTLKNKRFLITLGQGEGENRMADAINQATHLIGKERLHSIDNISIIIYYAAEGSQSLSMAEMATVKNFIRMLPESTETVWALYQDETMPPKGVRVSIIASGKDWYNG